MQELAGEKGRVAQLLKTMKLDAELVDALYLAALGRRASNDEQAIFRELQKDYKSRQEALEDLLWTLLNSSEFSFNH